MTRKPIPPAVAGTTLGAVLALSLGATTAVAEECENRGNEDADFGECRVLVEINSSDGDVGFHWLTDADDLNSTRIDDPDGAKVFTNSAFGPLREQKITETFGESSEPLCNPNDVDPSDPEDVVTLTEFRETWADGTYRIRGKGDQGEKLEGEAELTFYLPAAPQNLDFDGSIISWASGDDLGRCAPSDGDGVPTPAELVSAGVLDALPEDVPVLAWEVVLEPDVDDTDAAANLNFSTRVAGPGTAVPAGTPYSITLPPEYLAALGAGTPVKIEIGAIGGDFAIDGGEVVGRSGRPVDDDNATFSEEDGFCATADGECPPEPE
jgi:hypothetical protein